MNGGATSETNYGLEYRRTSSRRTSSNWAFLYLLCSTEWWYLRGWWQRYL